MNIFAVYFFIAFLAFHPFAFSQGDSDSYSDQGQIGTLLVLCLDEITTRRIALQEEMMALSIAMNEADDDSTLLSNYDKLIYQIFIKALILDTATKGIYNIRFI